MYPFSHFLVPFFIGVLLVKYGNFSYLNAFVIGLIGVFIDLDHFIAYVFSKEDFSLKHAWNAAVLNTKGKYKFMRTFLHHFVGFIIVSIVLILLFFINKIWFWIIFIGYYSHMFLDYFKFGDYFQNKKKVKIKEEGFVFKIPVYEIILNVVLIILLLFMLIYV